jgi:hypothetical protein
MPFPTAKEIRDAASSLAFGEPIIQNHLRALVVEAIIDFALKPTWRHCSGNWNGWDFEHQSGARLEVKQSALRQSWTQPATPGEMRFDIAPRTGYFEGATWVPNDGRNAHIYVFATHKITDETADQRDPSQWRFYIVETTKLPSSKTVGIPALRALSSEVVWGDLFNGVERLRARLGPVGEKSPVAR